MYTFATRLSFGALAPYMFPVEFRAEVNRQETRVRKLSSSEDRMIVACRFGMIPVCDRQTVGRSDGRSDRIYRS